MPVSTAYRILFYSCLLVHSIIHKASLVASCTACCRYFGASGAPSQHRPLLNSQPCAFIMVAMGTRQTHDSNLRYSTKRAGYALYRGISNSTLGAGADGSALGPAQFAHMCTLRRFWPSAMKSKSIPPQKIPERCLFILFKQTLAKSTRIPSHNHTNAGLQHTPASPKSVPFIATDLTTVVAHTLHSKTRQTTQFSRTHHQPRLLQNLRRHFFFSAIAFSPFHCHPAKIPGFAEPCPAPAPALVLAALLHYNVRLCNRVGVQ